MTSKNSFYNIFKVALKGRTLGIAVSCLCFFFAMPVYAAMSIGIIEDRMERLIFIPGVEKALYARDVLGENNELIMFFTLVLGIFMAFQGFAYLYSKSKVDLFHSVPAKRDAIFAAEYLAGVVAYVVPFVAFMIINLIIGAANGMLDMRGVGTAFLMLFINLLGFLAFYSTTIIAIDLTGNQVVGALGTLVFMFYGLVCQLLLIGYKSIFFLTTTSFAQESPFDSYCCPVTAFYCLLDGMNSFTGVRTLHPLSFVIFIIYTLVAMLLAFWVFKIRPSEAAGKSIAFKKAMPVISVFLLVPISLVGGIAFEATASIRGGIAYGWYAFGFIIALVIGHLIIQTIMQQDFKSAGKNLVNLAIGGAIAALIAITFIFDLTGYDTYVADDSKYDSIGIGSYAFQGNVEYYNFEGEVDEYGNRNIGTDLVEYRLKNIQITDRDLIHDIVNAGIADTKEEYKLAMDNINNFDYTADHYASVTIRYNMNNGKYVYRTYNLNVDKNIELYNRLYCNEDYKRVACPMMAMNPTDASDIGFLGLFGETDIKFSDSDMVSLVKAYAEDVAEQDVYSLRDEVPYGFLYKGVKYKENDYTSSYCTNKAYVYPSFKRTIEILKKYDIDMNYYKDIDNIVSIEAYNYSAFDDETGQSLGNKYTDKEDIKKIMEKAYPSDFVTVESALVYMVPVDLNITFKTSPYGYGTSMPYAFKTGDVPELILKDLQLEN